MSERRATSYAFEPPSGARLPHYLAAMLLVGCTMAGAVRALDRTTMQDAPSETQDAIMVDLPPTEAGAHPPGDDAPTQAAIPDAAGAVAPPKSTAEAEPRRPAIVEISKPPPRQQPTSAAAPQEAHEVGTPQDTHAEKTDPDDTESHRASAHQITLWQRAMMERLQAARRGLPHRDRPHGLAKIAFEIDRDGRLVSERLEQGSGSSTLDAAALALVRLAAPYPVPPRGAGAAQLAFVVPISFRP